MQSNRIQTAGILGLGVTRWTSCRDKRRKS